MANQSINQIHGRVSDAGTRRDRDARTFRVQVKTDSYWVERHPEMLSISV